ncbi:MAG: LysR family transcriptional regulator [Hyphomicrobiaceae bacterium]
MRELTADIDHDALRALIALADVGSLAGAARQLRVTHATIGRRIAALERTLEAVLFERTEGRYVLTAQGEPICRLAREIEDRMLAINRAAAGLSADVSGIVRVTATEGVGAFLVTPQLADLSRELPSVDFVLTTADTNLSLAHREADIALRFGLPETGHIVGRRAADISYHLYATPDYIARTAPSAYGFIAGPAREIALPGLAAMLHALRDCRVVFRSNSMMSRWRAARAGTGIALLPRFMGEFDASLQRVEIGAPPTLRELWLLTHRDVKDVPRIRAVADFLYDRLSEMRSQLD